MISEREHYGGGLYQSFGADLTISRGNGSHRTLVATTTGLKVKCEAMTNWRYRPKRRLLTLYNAGANAFDFCNSAGTVVLNVAAGKVAFVDLISISAGIFVPTFKARAFTPLT